MKQIVLYNNVKIVEAPVEKHNYRLTTKRIKKYLKMG